MEGVTISKELFLETLEEIKKQRRYDQRVALYYNNNFLLDQIIRILQIATNDIRHSDLSLIEYFIEELDFGENYYHGCITDPNNGTPIDISTPEKLYNYLVI